MRSIIALLSVSGIAMGSLAGGVGGSSSWEDTPVEMLEADFRHIDLSVDSGQVAGAAVLGNLEGQSVQGLQNAQRPVWSTVVRVEDADWLRLEFDQIDLSSATINSRESYLRITSLFDGYEQYLDTSTHPASLPNYRPISAGSRLFSPIRSRTTDPVSPRTPRDTAP